MDALIITLAIIGAWTVLLFLAAWLYLIIDSYF